MVPPKQEKKSWSASPEVLAGAMGPVTPPVQMPVVLGMGTLVDGMRCPLNY